MFVAKFIGLAFLSVTLLVMIFLGIESALYPSSSEAAQFAYKEVNCQAGQKLKVQYAVGTGKWAHSASFNSPSGPGQTIIRTGTYVAPGTINFTYPGKPTFPYRRYTVAQVSSASWARVSSATCIN